VDVVVARKVGAARTRSAGQLATFDPNLHPTMVHPVCYQADGA
jgi:hypothetical protein